MNTDLELALELIRCLDSTTQMLMESRDKSAGKDWTIESLKEELKCLQGQQTGFDQAHVVDKSRLEQVKRKRDKYLNSSAERFEALSRLRAAVREFMEIYENYIQYELNVQSSPAARTLVGQIDKLRSIEAGIYLLCDNSSD